MLDICESCTRKVYENGTKCIFHCDKNQKNGWIVHDSNTHESKKTKWDRYKVQEFWETFKSDINKEEMTKVEDFKIPIYWVRQYQHVDILYNSIEFRKCTFLDYFFLEDYRDKIKKEPNYKITYKLNIDGKESFVSKQKNLQDYPSLKFIDSEFCATLKLDSLQLRRLYIGSTQHNKENIKLISINIYEESEICRAKTVDNIQINDTEIKSSFELWCNECNDIEIEGGEYKELIIKNNKVDNNLSLQRIKLEKMKIQEQKGEYKIQELKLNNLDFQEDSRILFENILCDTLTLTKLSQDSKFIQFDHIEVKEKIFLSQNEFKNTYFNDFDISNATKEIEKTSFIDSSLNSIKWGKIFKIKASKDIFRQLKFVNDGQGNYIDANNFYSMEMKKHQNKLEKEQWSSNYWQEKLIFLLAEKISNHGQSWFLPLLWIIITNLGFFTIASLGKINDSISNLQTIGFFILIVTMSSLIFFIDKIIPISKDFFKNNKYFLQHLFIIFYLSIYIYYCSLGDSNSFVKFIGFKIPEAFETVLIWWLLNKITMSFLIYHFIIALRRQTKR